MGSVRRDPLAYLDTNAFIYALEGSAEVSEPMQRLFSSLRRQPFAAVTSEIALAEVLAGPEKRGESRSKELYLELMLRSGCVELVPVTREHLFETARLRAASVRKLNLPDALHLATAIGCGCRYFVTRDKGLRLPAGMMLAEPDGPSLMPLMSELRP